MRLRSGTYSPAARSVPEPAADLTQLPDGVATWRVPSSRAWAKAGAALVLCLATVVAPDAVWRVFAGLGALATAAHALRDLLLPVRLRADSDGLTVVAGLMRRERIGWADIECLQMDVRRHLGVSTRYLEIDVGATLHLFTQSELGVPVDETLPILHRLAAGQLTVDPVNGDRLIGSRDAVVAQDEDGDVVPGDLG